MPTNYLALDVGRARVGVALANDIARIASSAPALDNDAAFWDSLQQIIETNDIKTVVVGYPRGLDGQTTDQTRYVDQFVDDLKSKLAGIDTVLQDEALTSVKAEAELNRRGRPFSKGDIDSLSAVYILEDFLAGL